MKLGDVLKTWRRVSELNIRDAAREIGIGVSTLSRIENGETMDGVTLSRILTWLMSEAK